MQTLSTTADVEALLWALTLTNPRAPMKRGRTEAETCLLNGWTVGTRLVGTQGGTGWSNTSTIEITAIGEEDILAKRIDPGEYTGEGPWTLSCREWREVPAKSCKASKKNVSMGLDPMSTDRAVV